MCEKLQIRDKNTKATKAAEETAETTAAAAPSEDESQQHSGFRSFL